MGKRKIKILETAVTAVAKVSFFIESKDMPLTAKKFVDEAFDFLKRLLMKEWNTSLVQTNIRKI